MAEHETILEDMKHRFSYLFEHNQYDGKHAGEYTFLEHALCDDQEDTDREVNQLLGDSEFFAATDVSAVSAPSFLGCLSSAMGNKRTFKPSLTLVATGLTKSVMTFKKK